jgi:hypothetical protein
MGFVIILFVVIVGGCWLIGKTLGSLLFGKSDNKETYIDKSVHHHHYDNRSVYMDGKEYKNLKK